MTKTIKIKLDCNGFDGCNQISEIDYNITDNSLQKILENDPYLEFGTLFCVECPKCGKNYAFKPSKLKSMIIQ